MIRLYFVQVERSEQRRMRVVEVVDRQRVRFHEACVPDEATAALLNMVHLSQLLCVFRQMRQALGSLS